MTDPLPGTEEHEDSRRSWRQRMLESMSKLNLKLIPAGRTACQIAYRGSKYALIGACCAGGAAAFVARPIATLIVGGGTIILAKKGEELLDEAEEKTADLLDELKAAASSFQNEMEQTMDPSDMAPPVAGM